MKNIPKATFDKYIKECRHLELFNALGWNKGKTPLSPIEIGAVKYHPQIIAEQHGFQIISCDSENIPPLAERVKIANAMKNKYQKNITIFINQSKQEQVWLYLYTHNNRPQKVNIRYINGQNTERLYQRTSGLIFELDEYDKITIVDVSKRVNENFAQNTEKVTKKFYNDFKKQHTALLKLIEGIDNKLEREWYASIMLNRLMFCYFMQRRGFLNNDRNYLHNKLNECKTKFGKNNFYSFYRNFLLILFHKGFGSYVHTQEIKEMIGRIPYLNGGLFDIHEIERKNPDINIPDKAFEDIFTLFDTYDWYLDSRDCSSGDEINPDVLGYIFEKYINDRAEMGAYYTQEDITDYISRNSILPYLLEIIQNVCPEDFQPSGFVWAFLKNSGDKYIFKSVKKGIYDDQGNYQPLPEYVIRGLDPSAPDLIGRRQHWNEPALKEYALPTEIWRETVERRKRCEELSSLIKNGKITNINDFITYNIDINSFVVDLLESIENPKFILEFYKNIEKLTVLDPTCGSGAFLFAAMNILEPLYDCCLNRMADYISHDYKGSLDRGVKEFFEGKMSQMNNEIHPSKSYFIYKTIILNNLYGVDIMREAVETAKLRLFLKLVSTTDPDYRHENIGIEPLPDIDFNIKAGNTLIGIANKTEIKEAIFGRMFGASFENEINEKMKNFAVAVAGYKRQQLCEDSDKSQNNNSYDVAKKNLIVEQIELKKTLDNLLKESHYPGVRISNEKWENEYMLFHWVAEFYDIVERGGFDVVIGNPPYVALNKISYKIRYGQFVCSDIYGYVIYRSIRLMHQNSRHGFIVMHNLAFSKDFENIRDVIRAKASYAWFSFYGRIPAGLFAGDVRVRNCIYILSLNSNEVKNFYVTRMHRWFSEARPHLLFKLSYTCFEFTKEIPMLYSQELASIQSTAPALYKIEGKKSRHSIYFKQSAYNWISVSEQPAPCYDKNNKAIKQTQVAEIKIVRKELALLCLLLLNGKMFYSYWLTVGDEFHVTKDNLLSFRIDIENISEKDMCKLLELVKEFQKRIYSTIQYKLNAGKNVGTYNMTKLWDITDKSDLIFLKYIRNDFSKIQRQTILSEIDNHINLTNLTLQKTKTSEIDDVIQE
jgi:hypothetical protein